MLKLFAGLKGSGKTKQLIELVNAAQEKSNGNVICIEQGNKLIHAIKHEVRLIDVSDYSVSGWEKLYGLVCGILAANYDITDLFIDSALKICKEDLEGLAKFIEAISPLLEKENVSLTVTASIEVEKLPESLNKYLI